MKEVWKSIVATGGVRIYTLFAGLIVLFLTARVLGPEGRGMYAVVTTFLNLASVIGCLSLGNVALSYKSSNTSSPLAERLGTLLVSCVVLSVAVFVVVGLLVAVLGVSFLGDISPVLLVCALVAVPLFIWEIYNLPLLLAEEKIGVHNRALMVGKSAFLLGTVYFLYHTTSPLAGALIAFVLGQAITAVYGLFMLWKVAGGLSFSYPLMRRFFKDGLKLHPSTIAGVVIVSTDVLMLNAYKGAAEAGYYQLAIQLIGMMALVPDAAGKVMFEKVAALGADKAWGMQRKIMAGVSLFMFVSSIVAFFVVPLLIPIVVGEGFLPSIAIFQFVLLMLVNHTISMILAPQWVGRGWFTGFSVLSVATALANIGLNFWLIPPYGIWGAAYASVGALCLPVCVYVGMVIWLEKNKVHEKAV